MIRIDRVYTAIDYIVLMILLGVTINFAYEIFGDIFTFYQWFIMCGFGFSIVTLAAITYRWNKAEDLRVPDTITGTLVGAVIILTLNFVFSFIYATAIQPQSFTLSFLQLHTGLIISNLLIHMILIAPSEEIVFREVLFTPIKLILQRIFGIKSYFPDGLAYGFSSVLYFAIAHQVVLGFDPILMLFPIFSSVVLVYVRVKFGLYASVNAHRINNLITFIM